MKKFKVGDIVYCKKSDEHFFIHNVYGDCYDAAMCTKDGKLTGGSIDLWFDNIDDDYLCEGDVEKVN